MKGPSGSHTNVLKTLGALVVLVCLVAPFVLRPTLRFYTNDDTLREDVRFARPLLRQVLWEPVRQLGPAVNSPEEDEYEPAVSPDARYLAFTRGRPGGQADLWLSEWSARGWSTARPLEMLNTSLDEMGAAFATEHEGSDRLVLYFSSNRPGGAGGHDLWASLSDGQGGWGVPWNLGPQVNSSSSELRPSATADSKLLFFSKLRQSGSPPKRPRWTSTVREILDVPSYSILSAPRLEGHRVEFGEATIAHGLALPNSTEAFMAVAPQADFVYFASNRAGGTGGFDLYRSRLLNGALEPPENLGPRINTRGHELDPTLAPGGFELYFARRPEGGTSEDIFLTRSREVFLRSDSGEPYWSASAVLTFLRGALRGTDPAILALLLSTLLCLVCAAIFGRRMSRLAMLTRCLLLALIVHFVAALWMSSSKVHRVLMTTLGGETGTESFEVTVDSAAEEDVSFAIRAQTATTGGDSAPTLELGTPISPAVLLSTAVMPQESKLVPRLADLSAVAPARISMGASIPAPGVARPAEMRLSASAAPDTAEARDLQEGERPPDPSFGIFPKELNAPEVTPVRAPRTEFADRVLVATPTRAEPGRVAIALRADVTPESLNFQDDLTRPSLPELPPELGSSDRLEVSSPKVHLEIEERELASVIAESRGLPTPQPPRTFREAVMPVERGVPAEEVLLEAPRALFQDPSRPVRESSVSPNSATAPGGIPTRDFAERPETKPLLPSVVANDEVVPISPTPRGLATVAEASVSPDQANILEVAPVPKVLEGVGTQVGIEGLLALATTGAIAESASTAFEAPVPPLLMEARESTVEAETLPGSQAELGTGAPRPGSSAPGGEAGPRIASDEKPPLAYSRRKPSAQFTVSRTEGVGLQQTLSRPRRPHEVSAPDRPQFARDPTASPLIATVPLAAHAVALDAADPRIPPRGVVMPGDSPVPRREGTLLSVEPSVQVTAARVPAEAAVSRLDPLAATLNNGEGRISSVPAAVRASREPSERGEASPGHLATLKALGESFTNAPQIRSGPAVDEKDVASSLLSTVTLTKVRRTLTQGAVVPVERSMVPLPAEGRPEDTWILGEATRSGSRERVLVPDLSAMLPAPLDLKDERQIGPRRGAGGVTRPAPRQSGLKLAMATRSRLTPTTPHEPTSDGHSLVRADRREIAAQTPTPPAVEPPRGADRLRVKELPGVFLPRSMQITEPVPGATRVFSIMEPSVRSLPSLRTEMERERRKHLAFEPESSLRARVGGAALPGASRPRDRGLEDSGLLVTLTAPGSSLRIPDAPESAVSLPGLNLALPGPSSPLLLALAESSQDSPPRYPTHSRLTSMTPAPLAVFTEVVPTLPPDPTGVSPSVARHEVHSVPRMARVEPSTDVSVSRRVEDTLPSLAPQTRPRWLAPEAVVRERPVLQGALEQPSPGSTATHSVSLIPSTPRRLERASPRLEVEPVSALAPGAAPENAHFVAAQVDLRAMTPRGDFRARAIAVEANPRLPPRNRVVEMSADPPTPGVPDVKQAAPKSPSRVPLELAWRPKDARLIPERAPHLFPTSDPRRESTELARSGGSSDVPARPPRLTLRFLPSTSLAPGREESRSAANRVREPGALESVEAASSFVPRIYQLRAKTHREEAVRLGGGAEDTEKAVELGLKWLALHQSPDGRWSLDEYMDHLTEVADRDRWHPDWDGNGKNDSRGGSSRADNGDTAATGLALLAFLGHGDTQTEPGPYQENVRRGLQFLKSAQNRDGDLRNGGNLYMHAIASFALCEAYALSRDPELEEPARRAIGYAIRTQNPDLGGWRYEPYPQGRDVDTSVFGWMLMAIKSAHVGGIEVDKRAVQRMAKYLESARMSKAGGRFAYQPGLPRSSLAMTAQGLFCQQILSELRPAQLEAEKVRLQRAANETVSILLSNRPELRDQDGANSYYWYYATLALFQEEGVAWETWNSRMKEVLLQLQLREEEGTAAGSWDPLDRRAQLGGRVYSTAISILSLEVYYRYAPKERR